MPDLAERITTAIDRAEQVARAAEEWHPSPWRYEIAAMKRDAIVDRNGREVLSFAHHYEPTIYAVDFTVGNDPAAVLRRCAADRRVLERHRTPAAVPIEDPGPYTCVACAGLAVWPCDDIRDLADRYGIEVEA